MAGASALDFNVYVVEDDESVARSLMALLQAAGARTQRFSTADAFLESLDTLAAGCVLMDQSMPGTPGLDALVAMQERGRYWPLILMTGLDDADVVHHAKRLGAETVLEKPFGADVLFSTVRTASEALPA